MKKHAKARIVANAVMQPGPLKDLIAAMQGDGEKNAVTKLCSIIQGPRVVAPAMRGAKPPLASYTKSNPTTANSVKANRNGKFLGMATTGGISPIRVAAPAAGIKPSMSAAKAAGPVASMPKSS